MSPMSGLNGFVNYTSQKMRLVDGSEALDIFPSGDWRNFVVVMTICRIELNA